MVTSCKDVYYDTMRTCTCKARLGVYVVVLGSGVAYCDYGGVG